MVDNIRFLMAYDYEAYIDISSYLFESRKSIPKERYYRRSPVGILNLIENTKFGINPSIKSGRRNRRL